MISGVVIASLAYTLIALLIQVRKVSSYGPVTNFAEAQGKVGRGVIYAFGQGMMPWAKESAAKHLPTFLAGILYHSGIFAAGFLLVTELWGLILPLTVLWALRIVITSGLLCGLGLLVKRLSLPYMRFISCPDDYLSNLLVNVFLATALAETFRTGLQTMFFWVSIALFIYIPMGKIRHCVFFFYTRILFGTFFGRRGVLPGRATGE